ncbi:MAG: hypothetical protein ABR981_00750 [Candidatus Micrarchaeaceae archaeon]
MLTNYERVMKKFIPAFRLKAAKMMVNDYGIKQQQAAAILGTTQAAISKYLKESPEKFKDISIDEDLLANFVEKTTKNEKDGQRIMCRMCQDNKKFNCTFIVK